MKALTTCARWRWQAAAFGAVVFLAGCATDSVSDRRMARYRPETGGRRVGRWTSQGQSPESVTNAPPDSPWSRPLKKGDRITLIIQLTGDRLPEQRNDVVDDKGCVNFWRLGAMKIEGKTTSEAESLVEEAYRASDLLKDPSITIILQEDQYYVTGEVRKPGPYQIRGDVTLGQAIAVAGGPTEYAKLTDVKVKRKDGSGTRILQFDLKKIQQGELPDPHIQPDDLVEVGRTWVGLP